MDTKPHYNEPATEEQLELLHQLGRRIRINAEISWGVAQASIEFHQATARQLDYLRHLGYEITGPITKQKASELIGNRLKEREGKFEP